MKTISLVTGNQTNSTTLEELLQEAPQTILYFYPKNDTPGCTIEANDFTERFEAFQNQWVQLIGVSRDTTESHCKFIEKYWLRARYISDPDLELHKEYQARWEKNNYGKIVTGVIRGTVLLDSSWKVIHHWKNIRAKWHAERVLKFVSE